MLLEIYSGICYIKYKITGVIYIAQSSSWAGFLVESNPYFSGWLPTPGLMSFLYSLSQAFIIPAGYSGLESVG